MPYRIDNSVNVMVQRSGKWVLLKKHESHEKALAHLRALYANVKEK
jgi:hypothetical protein